MKKLIIAITLALTASCATPPMPRQQEPVKTAAQEEKIELHYSTAYLSLHGIEYSAHKGDGVEAECKEQLARVLREIREARGKR